MIKFILWASITSALLISTVSYPIDVQHPEETKRIAVCFTPGDNCDDLIANTIKSTKRILLIQAYGYSNKKITTEVIRADINGINVKILLDKSQKKSCLLLHSAGIPTYIDRKVAIQHNKVMIIDDHIVITGSYNFTESAQRRNAENVLIIDNAELAKLYIDNWYKRLNKNID